MLFTNAIHSLQSIRAKTNKRIKTLVQGHEESPFKHIPTEEKRKVLESLFVKIKEERVEGGG